MLRKIFNFKEYNFRNYNISVLLAAFMLSFIGLSVIRVVQDPADRLYEKQILGIAIGLLFTLVLSLVDYHFLSKIYIVFYLINLALLVATRLWGHSYHQAQRWLDIKGLPQIQPAEFTKFFMIVFIASLMSRAKKKINKLWFLLLICILVAIPLVLILVQPDLSTTIALMTMFVCMLYLAGLSYKLILPLVAVAIPLCAGFWWYIHQTDLPQFMHPYQINRILALENPELYPELMYQQNNAMVAIHRGGLAGVLRPDSDASVLSCRNLAAIESDFIYTLISEAYGFIGSMIVIGLIVFFVSKTFRAAFRAKDFLGMLIAGGVGSLIAIQTIINLCVNVSIFPNTGIPFPFMSSGLSSLIGNYLMIGLVMNVSLQKKERIRKDEDEFVQISRKE